MPAPDGAALHCGRFIWNQPADQRESKSLAVDKITLDKAIEEGDWLSVVCTLEARDRKTGAPVGMTGNVLVRIENGKLIEAYNHWGFLGLFVRLGLLPPNAFEKGLAGQKIAWESAG